MGWLKEEETILSTFTTAQISAFVRFKPETTSQRRLRPLCCLLVDTGLRITEALSLTLSDIDFDNLVIRVAKGKGSKGRLVPLSPELRKVLWHYGAKRSDNNGLLFPTGNGTHWSQRDVLRELKKIGKKLGITGVRLSLTRFDTMPSSELCRGDRGDHMEALR